MTRPKPPSGPSRSPASPAVASARLDEAEHFHRVLLGASTFFEKAQQDFLDEVGITPPQFYLLRTIGNAPQRALSPKQLQQSFVRRRNLTETVDRVVRDGLATREPNPEDGRSVLIVLTDTGDEVLRQAVAVYHRGLQKLFSGDDLPGLGQAACFLESFIDHIRTVISAEERRRAGSSKPAPVSPGEPRSRRK